MFTFFLVIIDVITRAIQYEVHWCMFFAYDIILVVDINRVANEKLKYGREILETEEICISRSKTEYIWCNFSNDPNKKRIRS